MSRPASPKGPRRHRFLVWFLSVWLTVLCFWLLGFVVRDIGKRPGPRYDEIEKQFVEQALLDELETLREETESLSTQIANQREIQQILQQSMEESKAAMDQLIALHRLNLEQAVKPSNEEQQALAESEKLFLDKQQEFQAANEQIARLSERLRTAEGQITALQRRRTEQSQPARDAFEQQSRDHRLRIAALKLGVVVPLLLAAAWVVLRWRGSAYAPILLAVLVAAFWRVGVVMHEYFPQEWFRYIAVGAGIAVVLAFLIQLIRSATSPGPGRLLKQNREAYHRGRCPVCGYAIRGDRHGRVVRFGKAAAVPAVSVADEEVQPRPYSCPACGERLFETCAKCDAIRHSLLPYCESCGDALPLTLGSGR